MDTYLLQEKYYKQDTTVNTGGSNKDAIQNKNIVHAKEETGHSNPLRYLTIIMVNAVKLILVIA